jgi:hypothetical protein
MDVHMFSYIPEKTDVTHTHTHAFYRSAATCARPWKRRNRRRKSAKSNASRNVVNWRRTKRHTYASLLRQICMYFRIQPMF